MKIQQIVIWIVAGVFIVGGGFFIFNNDDLINTSQETNTAIPPIAGMGIFDEGGSPIDINVIPVDLPTPPDMSGPILFPSNFQADAKLIVIEKIESLRESVQATPTNIDSWIELGLYWKLVEDYEKTEAAWLYAAEIDTINPVPLGNLGFLYGYFLNDSTKAEEYYLQAIERDPSKEYLYFQLAEFYRDVLKDISKARNIAEQGVAAIPENENLKALRDNLK